LEKLIPEAQDYLKTWKVAFDASRAERLRTLVVSVDSFRLTQRACKKPAEYLAGDLFQEYLKRTVPHHTKDMLEGLSYDITEQVAALFGPPNYDETEDFSVYVEVTAGVSQGLIIEKSSRNTNSSTSARAVLETKPFSAIAWDLPGKRWSL
jgi:hypothetical protein